MKINSIITAVNSNPMYLTFAPYVCKVWKHLHGITPIVGYIPCGNYDVDFLATEYLNPYCRLIIFPKLDIDNGIQSKITRLFLAAGNDDANSIIVDIDMIPMSKNFLRSYESTPEDNLIKFGADHFSFQKEPDIGKWPMHGTAASTETFKEIINPSSLDYGSLLNSWTGFIGDVRANVTNHFGGFSDESLLKELCYKWDNSRVTNIKRTDVPGDYNSEPVCGRLCRSRYTNMDDVKDLSKYYECHGPRPFHRNGEWYNKLLDYIKQ